MSKGQKPWERLHTTHLAAARMLNSPSSSPATPNRASMVPHVAKPKSARKLDTANHNVGSVSEEPAEEESELQQQVRAMTQEVARLSQSRLAKMQIDGLDDEESFSDSLPWDSASSVASPAQRRFNRRGKEVRDMLKYTKERNNIDLEMKGAWIESLRAERIESPISPRSFASSRASSRRNSNSNSRASQSGRNRKGMDDSIGEAFGTKAMELKFREIRDAVRVAQ
eukprot:1418868-Rhodomonas_salina.1